MSLCTQFPVVKLTLSTQFPITLLLVLITGDFVNVVGFHRKMSSTPPIVACPSSTSHPPGVMLVSSIMLTAPPAYSLKVWLTTQLTVEPTVLPDTVHLFRLVSVPTVCQNTMSFVRSQDAIPEPPGIEVTITVPFKSRITSFPLPVIIFVSPALIGLTVA